MSKPSTSVSVLTPAGRGAIAVVEVSGEQATSAVDAIFHPASGRSIADQPEGRILFGRWNSLHGEEVVVCQRSPTDDANAIEVHCHGGRAAIEAVCQSLVAVGCKLVAPTESLQRGSLDLLQQAAQLALAETVTERTALILLDQLNGALSQVVTETIERIDAGQTTQATELLTQLIGRWKVGRRLTSPARIVLTGPPNVGKSSLINALVGYQRAIVFDQPGTTRDVVAASSAIEGWPVELIDTAGLRESDCQLEQAGVSLAHQAIASADLLLVVDEAAQLLAHPPLVDSPAEHAPAKPTLRIASKIDQLSKADQAALAQRACNGALSLLATSATTGEGIEQLLQAIAQALVPAQACFDSSADSSAVPFRQPDVDSLQRALQQLASQDTAAASQTLRTMLTGC